MSQLALEVPTVEHDRHEPDETNINSVLLYFSDDQLAELKASAQALIQQGKADNLSLLFLQLAKDASGNGN